MRKVIFFLLTGLACSAASAAPVAEPAPAQALANDQSHSCKSADASEVVVCGHSQERYRIDPTVLAATRAAEALPPKPPITGDVPEAGCAGPNCGGGSYVPLVGMALTALKAAELAADGDDWREAFRTHPDEYRAYQSAKAKKGGVSIGVNVGNR